ncbi:MAG: phosphoglycerate kinase, partial [Candidatus Wildermuthbacteria bacterium]|nr:phosphoglycerate kinase [Candidatus Wildermuthbacteria bacterium]
MKLLRYFSVRGKRVLVRCDFNVPVDEKGNILDDFRIRQTIPTIAFLLSRGAKIILMSHLGDPEGKVVPYLSVRPIQENLMEYLDCSVTLAPDCIGNTIRDWTLKMRNGEVLLLENLRFHGEEELNDRNFAKELAALGDIFVNDAFSVSHRAHASIVGVPQLLPSGAGLLLEKEIHALSEFSKNPKHPFVVVVGGSKAKDKLSFVDAMSRKADTVLIGNLLAKEALSQKLEFSNRHKIVFSPDGALDIGPKTIELFKTYLTNAKSVFWVGPLGKTEEKKYAKGSLAIAKAIVKSNAVAIAGGGDLAEFLQNYGLREKFSYVSAGGGATLAFVSGQKLPGLAALGYYDDDTNIRMYTN